MAGAQNDGPKGGRTVDPALSAKRRRAGLRGAAARWGTPDSSARPGIPGQVLTDVWRHLENRDARPRPEMRAGQLRIRSAGAAAEIYLYDEIGFWGVTAQDFIDELQAVDADSIDLHVNSPGGDVFDGVAIYNALADHPAMVNVIVDGLAASAASFISMAGDRVTMNRGAQMMIHDASGICIGNATDMQLMVDILDRISGTIADIYAARAGEDTDFWRGLMRAETWYTGPEAVAAGLADGLVAGKAKPDEDDDEDSDGGDDESMKASFDLTVFQYAGRVKAPAPPIHKPAAGPPVPAAPQDTAAAAASAAAEPEPATIDAADLARRLTQQLEGAPA